MNARQILAVTAIVMTGQAYAAPLTTVRDKQGLPSTGQQPLGVKPVDQTKVVGDNPGLVVTPTKMTGITVSATSLMIGSLLTVKIHGVGDPTNAACGSDVSINYLGGGPSSPLTYHGVSETEENFTKWPKTQSFNFTLPGQYEVKLGVYAGAPASCGYSGPGSIPGDLTKIQVVESTAK